MDDAIIDNWNAKVANTDIVYHLGDFAWKRVCHYRSRLNGQIVLIMGNHDHKRLKGCESVFEKIHTFGTVERIHGLYITMCHYSMRVWDKSHFGCWHIYGHSHSGLSPVGKSWDVGVDNNNYTPISFPQLAGIMDGLEENFNFVRRLPGFNEEEFNKAKEEFENGVDLE